MGALHFISTGRQTADEFAAICARIHPYADAIHIREKEKTAREVAEFVAALLYAGVPPQKIIVNDRVDVAAVYGVGGVQIAYHSLPVRAVRRSFPDLTVGCSVHSLTEAKQAEEDGAHFCLYGHMFPTASKPGLPPRSIDSLREMAASVCIPVIAIGGIHAGNACRVMEAGAAGVAVLSAVFLAPDPVVEARRLAQIVRGERKNGGTL
ncbi:thiazole tautomerase TenI [Anoxybacillus geothermalis]|jgi:thiazole tautomerase (transcriptional regulator TenI)|uniref:thiazole tautomerase TenI n=1 Tax=Geobacillus stearothermophilus TaxID=1422 RepID=UPI0025A6309C|nr:thiazole tautomerase TenI [Anoxybacillus geothermalis]MED4301149.1 thiazole tautomerase TenI [Geobacillus stearothermophilus]MED4879107.1 thiazole tautomerase TenI [Anoxybacillus geothermalis]WJQ07715.1 thiazole tautomerase TenI [Geobacillus stearothermophilus]WJQ11189.1 thiazole tautomerase TenI [Geobacillus stearothermophilus]